MTDKHWYLIEDFDPSLDYRGSKVLSLTPEACFELDRRGIVYSIPEDYYEEKELRRDEKEYFREQLKWIRDFDGLFQETVPYCREENIGLVHAHIYQLKHFVDSVIIQSRVFNAFVQANADIGSILYVCREKSGKERFTVYDLYNNRREFMLPLARKASAARNIPFSTINSMEGSPISVVAHPVKGLFKEVLRWLNGKEIFDFFKYGKIMATFEGRKTDEKINALSLHAGCSTVDSVLKRLVGEGGRVFLKRGDDIVLLSSLSEKKVLSLKPVEGDEKVFKAREFCGKVYRKFIDNHMFIGWINSKCGLDVTEIVRPYFADFVENICSRDLAEIPRLEDFYRKEKIDFVIARSSSEKASISSLLAAASSQKRVCFQHSCAAMDSAIYDVTELDLFDHYFAMHDEAQHYMQESLKRDYVSYCEILQEPSHLEWVNRRWGHEKRDEKLVMYIPTKIFTGMRAFNETYSYPSTWYYRLQKVLVDLFGTKTDFKFIFKCAEGQDWLNYSILRFIKKRGYKNIFIEKKRVADCLGKVGKVLLDCPSTSLYEAAAAGIPVMCLYRDTFKIRDLSVKLFGVSLREFRDIPEAARIAEDFLDGDAAKFKVGIPLSGEDAVHVLHRIKDRKAVEGRNRKIAAVQSL